MTEGVVAELGVWDKQHNVEALTAAKADQLARGGRCLVVPPNRVAVGWVEKRGMFIGYRPFTIVGKLPDGNYLVRDPKAASG